MFIRYESLVNQVLLEGSEQMEITRYEIWAVGMFICNLPAVVLYPVASRTEGVEPCDFHVFGPQKKHLAEQQSAADAKVMWFGLVWFGLFVHPFSHIHNNGNINYRLQFTTQLILYGHPHNTI